MFTPTSQTCIWSHSIPHAVHILNQLPSIVSPFLFCTINNLILPPSVCLVLYAMLQLSLLTDPNLTPWLENTFTLVIKMVSKDSFYLTSILERYSFCRNVIFYEDIFPFLTFSYTHASADTILISPTLSVFLF